MEYERIDKTQNGIISPSKLRMKLMGAHHHKKKEGSNCNSSRTSPSRLEDAEFVNSLLASKSDSLDDEVTSASLEILSTKPSSDVLPDQGHGVQTSCEPKETMPRENVDTSRVNMQHVSKHDSGNSSAIHLVRTTEDENLDYDSNASSSSFEFHKGERSVSNPATRSLLRPMPSKWNDAEKWIMNRQNIQSNYSKKNFVQSQLSQANRAPARVAPESANYDHLKLAISRVTETKGIDFCQPTTSNVTIEKFSFVPSKAHSVSGQAHGRVPTVVHSLPQSKDLKDVNELVISCSSTDDQKAIPGIRSVAMRDMGTEMTPMTSQEPSQTATPVGSISPMRSPTSSMPSTPRRDALPPMPFESKADKDSQFPAGSKTLLSEEEIKLKTRREIAALGMQLGKTNIAAWASKDEQEKNKSSGQNINQEELERIEFEKRANLWMEAEKSKNTARHRREEIKIQAWESQQKAKLEAEMRRIESKVEQMRAQAHAKIVKRIALARQRSEEKRAAAEARKNREADKTAAQAEYIRQTGRMPSLNYSCCGWL
ncbi:hypothetical protein QN277_009943 [Acacia crassicarpa]|uniref:Remorin C-terminal domain-containing protein n=1 Tax=Acacia crassicarpa TaxID=499986 RepID=A0AAE1IQT3_9FABA|nr:hypothetical protein QN277_009943 [Acacia crassicarpa]